MKRTVFSILLICISVQSCGEKDLVWVFIDPIQCMGNPWEQARLKEYGNNQPGRLTPEEELDLIEEYYEDQGVTIYRVKRTYPYNATCDACSCPRGDRIHCSVRERDIDRLLEMGFTVE